MTDPVLRLEPERVTVEPGGQASVQVTVHNPGTIVESYAVDVVGEQPIDWAEVLPPTVSVYPQQQETVTVVFQPPGGPGTPGGLVPFGVRATSEVDPSARSVVEGELTIGQVSGLQATLIPVTSSGRWRGRHTVQISNWGNAPARLRLVASDPDQALGFLIRPEVVEIPLGGTATARLKVRTRKPMLRGTPTRLPFHVVGEPDPPVPAAGPVTPYADPSRPTADGALNQKPILSRMTVSAAVLVVGALVAGLVFALTRPAEPSEAHGDGVTVPGAPTVGQVEVTGPSTLRVSWTRMTNIDSYELHYYTAGKSFKTDKGIDARQDAQDVQNLKPQTQYCFTLSAVNGPKQGPESEPQCAWTQKAPPASTPPSSGPSSAGPPSDDGGAGQTGTAGTPPSSAAGTQPGNTPATVLGGPNSPVFMPDDWIAVASVATAASSTAEARIRDVQRALATGGTKSGVLLATGQYPGIRFAGGRPLGNDWVAFIGPVASADEAAAVCDDKGKKADPLGPCLIVQPMKAG